MVASYGDRHIEDVGDRIDSLETAWLLHAAEQRYAVEFDVDDTLLGRMCTVDGAVEVFGKVAVRARGA